MAKNSQPAEEVNSKRVNIWGIFLGIVAVLAAVAGWLAIPGMPKLFHFDKSESTSVAASAGAIDNHGVKSSPAPVTATDNGGQPESRPQPLSRAVHQPASEHLPGRQKNLTPPNTSTTEMESPSPQAAPASQPQQHCETGSVCLGDNHGTVNVNNTPAVPPIRQISEQDAMHALRVLSRVGPGHSVDILANSSSKETTAFAFQIHRILSVAGWRITPNAALFPMYDSDSVRWTGKGFVCTGYVSTDPTAAVVIEAIKDTGFPCEEKPVDPAYAQNAVFTLLIGTRGRIDE